MDLAPLVETSFVLLQAEWSVAKSRQLLDELRATHIIVHRGEPHDSYYLYRTYEARARLAAAFATATIEAAFDLPAADATPLSEIHDRIADDATRTVVHEDGRLIGFFDAALRNPPSPARTSFAPGATAQSAAASVAATAPRSLEAEFPAAVKLHDTASLTVWLAAANDTAGRGIRVDLPPLAIVDVIVQTRQGFVVEGRGEGQLTLSGPDETLPLQFKLRATELGPGRIRVLAFHEGQSLGVMTLGATVGDAPAPADRQRLGHERPLAPISFGQPDLSLLILEGKENGETVLTMRLTAQDPREDLQLKPFGSIRLRGDPFQYFADFFKDIEQLPLNSARDQAIAEQKLAAKGANLFSTLLPTDLQSKLWELRHRIQSVQVQSEEPWVPWELCRLCGQEDGRVVEGPFLCEQFAVTRWLPGLSRRLDLKLSNMAVVVPADSGLPFAPQERDYLLGLGGPDRAVKRIPATFLDLRRELASGQYDAWHFSGHGAFRSPDPNKATMLLENRETLTPEEISGAVANLGLAKPLVFLNACQIGQSAMSLTDIGGWARQFLHAGASAFVGAYWSVFDQPAFEFARALYDRLLAGVPIGRAAQEARAAIKPAGDASWLAYTVFADPLAAKPVA